MYRLCEFQSGPSEEVDRAYARTSVADRLAPDISRDCDPIFARQRDAGTRWDECPVPVKFGVTFVGLHLAVSRNSYWGTPSQFESGAKQITYSRRPLPPLFCKQ